jgi:elongation factor P--(R)-beta-lysine ligase
VLREERAWRPTASPDLLRLRAVLLARIREYFACAGVLEVDTPTLSTAGATDPAIQSFTTAYHGPGPCHGVPLYLHTSPEFPMKRLLAAGIGSIYQICKVFRDGESGRFHNPEYTLLEWYRTGFDHAELMVDVESLLREVLRDILALGPASHWTYRELFRRAAGIDPFAATAGDIRQVLHAQGIRPPDGLGEDDIDGWLDLLLTHVIEPALDTGLVFVSDYPASQAALARLLPGEPPVAARFEVYLDGVELANGYHELADVAEQRRRFERDAERRDARRFAAVEPDTRLLAALEAGLPDCAGVALGIDRLLMIAGKAGHIDEVMAFPLERA